MSRHFLFTCNNYEDDWMYAFLGLPDAFPDKVKFIAFQEELAPETGTPHLQGYIVMHQTHRVTGVAKFLPNCHIEKRRGSVQEALDYVSKDESRKPMTEPYCNGVPPPGQGYRSDVEGMAVAISAGMSLVQLWELMPGNILRMGRAAQLGIRLQNQLSNTVLREITTQVYWGATGTGKSTRAWRLGLQLGLGSPFIWTRSHDSSRALGYSGERVIILDDFRDGWFPIDTLLRILDGFPHPVTTFGEFTYAKWTNVWITSNIPPRSWYANEESASREALFRRLDVIRRISFDNEVAPWHPS